MCRRKLLPRSGASLTFIPDADGGGGGKAYLYGGQEPLAGIIFDDVLVRGPAAADGCLHPPIFP